MSAATDRARAREWLEAQIAELRTLRNASTRDSGFKQWRQHTPTLIQRIWAGDPSRPGRFKRIPFTLPGKPDPHQVQLAYAKGCTEAMTCLRAMLKDLEGEGDGLAAAVESATENEPRPAVLPDSLTRRSARGPRISDAAVATGQERVLRLVPPPQAEIPSEPAAPTPPLAKKIGPDMRRMAQESSPEVLRGME